MKKNVANVAVRGERSEKKVSRKVRKEDAKLATELTKRAMKKTLRPLRNVASVARKKFLATSAKKTQSPQRKKT